MPTRVGGRPRQKPGTPSEVKMCLTTWRGLLKEELLWSWVLTTSRGQVTVEEMVPAKPPERMDTAEGERVMRGLEAGGAVRAEAIERRRRRDRKNTKGDCYKVK